MQPDDLLRTRIKGELDAAMEARRAGDEVARAAALERAWHDAQSLGDAALWSAVSWRRAKAHYDAGNDAAILEALAPWLTPTHTSRSLWGIREAVGPFDLHPPALRALDPISTRVWDRLGYRAPLLDALWTAWIEAQQTREHPFLADWGRMRQAWGWAVTGRLEAVRQATVTLAKRPPHHHRDAPHTHPRAAGDAGASTLWLQLDAARTLLRAATWSGHERWAWEARELAEDARVDLGLVWQDVPHLLDARVRATLAFPAWTLDEDASQAYRTLATTMADPLHRMRAEVACARLDGTLAHEGALATARHAASVQRGPEWTVDAWLDADAMGVQGARDAAMAEASRAGVHRVELAEG